MLRIDNANKVLLALINNIIQDDDVFKLMYYVDGKYKDTDLYSLPIPLNQEGYEIDKYKTLYNQKVFCNKRVDTISLKADIAVFINLYSVSPTRINYKDTKYMKKFDFQIGIVCANSVRETLNGFREVALMYRIMELLEEKTFIGGIGKLQLTNVFPIFDVPNDYIAYSMRISCDSTSGIYEFK